MKKMLVVFLFLPVMAWAQDLGDLSNLDTGKMMAMAQEMQACFAKVDQAELEKLGEEAQAKGDEIQALCAEGKVVEARATAIAFAKELMANPEMQTVQECSEKAREQLPVMAWGDVAEADSDASSGEGGTDICDMNL